MSRLQQLFAEQRTSNLSGLPHYEAFATHRQHQTQLIRGLRTTPEARSERLCILGAGNAYDLELGELLSVFSEVHLVDIDAVALKGARERVAATQQERVFTHGPIDLSGWFQHLERWGRMQVTPQELMNAPIAGAKSIAAALPGPFDVVVSTCLLTQLQLTLLQMLGEQHQLFVALREFLTLTHLRSLAALTKPAGKAALVTDLCERSVFPAGRPCDEQDLAPLMQELVASGHVIHSSHPDVIRMTLAEDPLLARTFAPAELSAPWLWQNGPERCFLVYGLLLGRRPAQ